MIIIVPEKDSVTHDITSTVCKCGCEITYENGEMILTHNLFDPNMDTKWLMIPIKTNG